jgi:hypothetical protein
MPKKEWTQDEIVKARPSLTEGQASLLSQEAIDEYYKLDGKTCPTCLKMFKSYTGRRVHEGNAHWNPKPSARVKATKKAPRKREQAPENISQAIDRAEQHANSHTIAELLPKYQQQVELAILRVKASAFDSLMSQLGVK